MKSKKNGDPFNFIAIISFLKVNLEKIHAYYTHESVFVQFLVYELN